MKRIPTLKYGEIARFWSKVDVCSPGQCWDWQAGKYASGYGQFKTRGRSYKAPRVAYAIATGKDPGELNVLHTCDNRPCCNPKHLWRGTLGDNNRDRAAKGRTVIRPRMGESHPRAVLTNQIVRSIRRSKRSHASLGRQHGVHENTIAAIRQRKIWKHVA